MFPQETGYYLWTSGAWVKPRCVPCDHIVGWKPNTSFLMRDICHVDRHGIPSVAYAGLYFDGVSWWNQNYGEYFLEGLIHDSGCAICRSMPPGEERRHAQAAVDERFHEALLSRGMHPIRAAGWYRVVQAHAFTRRNAVMPCYVSEIEAYYRACGLPEQAVRQGLRIAGKHRRRL